VDTAFVTVVFSRRIVGWRTADAMPTGLPLDALEMAIFTRTQADQLIDGVIDHSDAGSQVHQHPLHPATHPGRGIGIDRQFHQPTSTGSMTVSTTRPGLSCRVNQSSIPMSAT